MSLIILNNWFVNNDKSIMFYDKVQNVDYSTGNKKKVIVGETSTMVRGNVVKSNVEENLYEHKFVTTGCALRESTQFTGYELVNRTVHNRVPKTIIFVLALGRRIKENKKFVQEQKDVEILFGLSTESDYEPKPDSTTASEVSTTEEKHVVEEEQKTN
jgi:hypothetical protein